LVPSAIEAKGFLSRISFEVNSAEMCWASPKLPPLPARIILPPKVKDSAHFCATLAIKSAALLSAPSAFFTDALSEIRRIMRPVSTNMANPFKHKHHDLLGHNN
jgi:hypothetical protein